MFIHNIKIIYQVLQGFKRKGEQKYNTIETKF